MISKDDKRLAKVDIPIAVVVSVEYSANMDPYNTSWSRGRTESGCGHGQEDS
jgi:hypothetical protein